MSDTTFQQYVEKNKLKFTGKQTTEEREIDLRHISTMADSYKTTYDEKGGFSKDLVARAAKFVAKSQQYGLTARKINVSDSPIYYKVVNGQKTARGWRERKKLEDAGKQLIKTIKQKDALYADLDMGENITTVQTKEWERQPTDPLAPPLNSDIMMDKFVNKGLVDDTDDIILDETKILDKNKGLLQKRTRDILNQPLKPFDVYKQSITTQMFRKLDVELKTMEFQNKTKEEIQQKRAEFHQTYRNKVDRIRKLYSDVEKGLVSPDALKLFLEPDVMTVMTGSIYNRIYHGMEGTHSDVDWEEQNPGYQQEVQRLVDMYEPDQILDQKKGTAPYTDTTKWQNLKSGKVKGTPEELAEEEKKAKDIIRQNMKYAENFTHFRGRNYVPGAEGTKRFYITCKRDKFKDMAHAWINAMEKNQEIKEDVMFKLSGSVNTYALDNIVLYVPANVEMDKIQKLLDDFSSDCGADVLADENETIPATKFVKQGIAQAVNFPLKQIYGAVTSEYDRSAFAKMRDIFQPNLGFPETNPSYNQHIAKLLYLAVSMTRKAHPELPADAKISANKELMKEVKQNFSDFIRLSGIDPATINEF